MRPEVFHVAFTNFPIDRVHSRCVHADENFTRCGCGRGASSYCSASGRRSCEFESLSWLAMSCWPIFLETLRLYV